jgi:hypothetical protein
MPYRWNREELSWVRSEVHAPDAWLPALMLQILMLTTFYGVVWYPCQWALVVSFEACCFVGLSSLLVKTKFQLHRTGQAGKAKPQTGVVLRYVNRPPFVMNLKFETISDLPVFNIREGTDVSRDSRTGDVLAELLVKRGDTGDLMPVVATFTSPWALGKAASAFFVSASIVAHSTRLLTKFFAATGSLFDVECRDSGTGDGAFMAVSPSVGGSILSDLKEPFFVNSLFSPTGRFSFYGQPTDIKVKSSVMKDDYRIFDVSFSTLSQSTQTEIPRKARVIATIPSGSSQVVMLVSSASAIRWKKGSEKQIVSTIESFKAIPAPQTSMKIRAQDSTA